MGVKFDSVPAVASVAIKQFGNEVNWNAWIIDALPEQTGKLPSYLAEVHCDRKVIVTPNKAVKTAPEIHGFGWRKEPEIVFISVCLPFVGKGETFGAFKFSVVIKVTFLRKDLKVSLSENVLRFSKSPWEHTHVLGPVTVGLGVALWASS